MRATIRDSDALRALRPLEVADYLRAHSWRRTEHEAERASVWLSETPSGDELEVLLPLDRALADYTTRMFELLQVLEAAEERAQLSILRDITTSRADIIRVYRHYADTAEGTIPIDDAVEVVGSARDMMMAAACAVVERKPYYHARRFREAADYVDGLRMGQTEQGSFVMTILSRVPPDLTLFEDGTGLQVEQPFERRVTTLLARALEAVTGAAAQGTIDAFQDVVPHGVSANLCAALVGLSEKGEDHGDVSVSITWSPVRPPSPGVRDRTVLPADAMEVIEEAARILRETSPREEFELTGLVTKLERGPQATAGRITILGFVDQEARKVSVQLAREAYQEAIRAHRDWLPVTCYGELVKDGQNYALDDARGFVVEEDTE